MKIKNLFAAICLAFLCLGVNAQDANDLDKYNIQIGINDFAQTLSGDTRQEVDRLIADIKKDFDVDVCVVVFDYLPDGYAIRNRKDAPPISEVIMADTTIDILLLMSIKDRKIDIVANGKTRDQLSSGTMNAIKYGEVVPSAQKHDFDKAVSLGVNCFSSALNGTFSFGDVPQKNDLDKNLFFCICALVTLIITVIAIWRAKLWMTILNIPQVFGLWYMMCDSNVFRIELLVVGLILFAGSFAVTWYARGALK